MAIIGIDGGHGFNTNGKRTPNLPNGRVIREWEFNHPTARFLKTELEALGHTIIMLSDTDIDTSLPLRVKKANDNNVDLIVSIHYNAYKGIWGSHGGIETLYCENSVKGQALANLVQREVIQTSNLRDRGVKARSDLYLLNKTIAPAILIECGFMDNLDEAKLMLDVNYQIDIARATTKAIQEFLGIKATNPINEYPNVSKWALDAWKWGVDNNIIDGNDPQGICTREMVMAMIYRAKGVE